MLLSSGDIRARKIRLAEAVNARCRREEKETLEGSLIEFYKAAWETMDADPYQHNWHLDAIAEHLEAVSYGHIRKLLINLPPRHSKTLLVSVAWNAWAWCRPIDKRYPLLGPSAKFMCLSYADPLAMDNAVLTRRLITSSWYQDRWANRFALMDDQDAKNKFDTSEQGTRISGSFKGTVTGRGAGIRVYDDPHKMDEVESDTIREGVLRLYDTTLKSRITDPRTSAEVLIAQRGHVSDLSAKFLESGDVVHLNLPAEYDSTRHCVTVLKYSDDGEPEETWEDPRTTDGQLLWPERFGRKELAPFKDKPDKYEWNSQWQQAPTARGGGLFKDDWWQVHEVVRNEKGAMTFTPEVKNLYVLASLDTAFSENESNDYSALTVWVCYDDPVTKHRRILLVDGWQKRLPEMSGVPVERNPGETEAAWVRRAQPKWGLAEWVGYTCNRRRVNRLIIENKNRAPDAVRAIKRLFADSNWGVEAVNVHGHKWSRALAAVDIFTDGMVYAPAEILESGEVRFLPWADDVMREISAYPRGAHDDMIDSMSLAMKYLRDRGWTVRKDERAAEEREAMTHRGGARQAIYPA